jgi:hypothetical protein
LVLGFVAGLPLHAWSQDKEKNTIKALFNGIPEDLRSKVKENAVRRDRVNDWLAEHVNGKGKIIEVPMSVDNVRTTRNSDGTYSVKILVAHVKAHALDSDWQTYLSDEPKGQGLSFIAVSGKDAEKLIDSKKITVEGKVKEIKLVHNRPGLGGSAHPVINILLEDIRIDGRAFTPPVELIKSKKVKGK